MCYHIVSLSLCHHIFLKGSILYCFSYSKREVNKKVLKVPGIEQKVNISFFIIISISISILLI
jgi:hypothetical protein